MAPLYFAFTADTNRRGPRPARRRRAAASQLDVDDVARCAHDGAVRARRPRPGGVRLRAPAGLDQRRPRRPLRRVRRRRHPSRPTDRPRRRRRPRRRGQGAPGPHRLRPRASARSPTSSGRPRRAPRARRARRPARRRRPRRVAGRGARRCRSSTSATPASKRPAIVPGAVAHPARPPPRPLRRARPQRARPSCTAPAATARRSPPRCCARSASGRSPTSRAATAPGSAPTFRSVSRRFRRCRRRGPVRRRRRRAVRGAITRSYSSQSSCCPPAAVKISRRRRRNRSPSMPSSGSSGPANCTGPSTPAHCHPARSTTVARGRARRLTRRREDPAATNATTGWPAVGWSSTPALTTEDWMVPSARLVDTTTRPWSNGTRRANAARSLIACVLPQKVRPDRAEECQSIGLRDHRSHRKTRSSCTFCPTS